MELKKASLEYEALLPLWEFHLNEENKKEEYIEKHKHLTCYVKDLLDKSLWDLTQAQETVSQQEKEDWLAKTEIARRDYGIRPLEREIVKFRSWQSTQSSKKPQHQVGFAELNARNML